MNLHVLCKLLMTVKTPEVFVINSVLGASESASSQNLGCAWLVNSSKTGIMPIHSFKNITTKIFKLILTLTGSL